MPRRSFAQIVSDRGFDHVWFDLPDEWYTKRLWAQQNSLPLARNFTRQQEKEILEGLGPDTESFGYVSQIAKSKKGYSTLLTKTGQEIQFLPRAEGTGSAVKFRHGHVNVADALLLLETLERKGKSINIDDIKLTGSRLFVRNMRQALQAAYEHRYDAVLAEVTAQHQNIRGLRPMNAAAARAQATVDDLATELSGGSVPSDVISSMHREFKARKRPVNPETGPIDWQKMSQDVKDGLDRDPGLRPNDPFSGKRSAKTGPRPTA